MCGKQVRCGIIMCLLVPQCFYDQEIYQYYFVWLFDMGWVFLLFLYLCPSIIQNFFSGSVIPLTFLGGERVQKVSIKGYMVIISFIFDCLRIISRSDFEKCHKLHDI